MQRNILFLFLIVIVILASCREQSQPNQPVAGGLSGTMWHLTQIDTGGGVLTLSIADTVQFQFNDDRRISGSSAGLCGNHWIGVYSVFATDSIRMDSFISTEMVCPQSQYWNCYNYLMRAETFQRSGLQLGVYCDGGIRKLSFKLIQ